MFERQKCKTLVNQLLDAMLGVNEEEVRNASLNLTRWRNAQAGGNAMKERDMMTIFELALAMTDDLLEEVKNREMI